MALYADGVLAGAYRGSRAADYSRALNHAVSDEAFQTGRLRRGPGEALCNPRLDMSGQRLPLGDVTCPRCRDIVVRLVPSCPR